MAADSTNTDNNDFMLIPFLDDLPILSLNLTISKSDNKE